MSSIASQYEHFGVSFIFISNSFFIAINNPMYYLKLQRLYFYLSYCLIWYLKNLWPFIIRNLAGCGCIPFCDAGSFLYLYLINCFISCVCFGITKGNYSAIKADKRLIDFCLDWFISDQLSPFHRKTVSDLKRIQWIENFLISLWLRKSHFL